MNATSTPVKRARKILLLTCTVLLTFAGKCDKQKDPLVYVDEIEQRSVTEDPAVTGNFPFDWRAPRPAATASTPEKDEIYEFNESLSRSKAPRVVQTELMPGATRVVELKLEGPSGLTASVQWIGTDAPLNVAISMNGSILTTGLAASSAKKRGESRLQAETQIGGRAELIVTNTSKTKVKVRLLMLATSR